MHVLFDAWRNAGRNIIMAMVCYHWWIACVCVCVGLYSAMADGVLHWKEISAALALTTLANSRLQTRQT